MDSSSVGSHAHLNTFNTAVELLPNPDFVFPMAPPPPENSSLSVDAAYPNRLRPLQTLNATRRTPAHGQRKSVNALPDFSFNPSGTAANLNPTTPPLSPLPTSPTTPRNVGHRRGGSEFIGGTSRGVNVLSSSPTKAEGMLPPPVSNLLPGPPPGRRGHAHRRSAAISSHDLSSILQPTDANANGRGGSAPATPRESEMSNWPRHTAHKSISQPSLHVSTEENQEPKNDGDQSPRRPPSRARVGFSDRVEYIRPLSTISSETESSMSTVRGHSVSNSLSSVISAGAPSPPSSRMARPFLNTTFENEDRIIRPKTAGAVLDMATKAKDGFSLDLFGRQRSPNSFNLPSPGSPSPLPSPVIRPSKKKFFNLNHRRAQPSADLLTSNSEPTLVSSSLDSPPASPTRDFTLEMAADGSDASRSSKDKSKKARKVKSWTKPFGSKKPKSPLARPVDLAPQMPTQDIPTPPPSSLPLDELSLDDLSANFDVDNTVTIVTPTSEVVPPRPQLQTDIASWQPKHLSSPDSDSRSPVIDLDLALGPFDAGKRERGTGRNFASARRTMHSSGFAASLFPGNMNHRRTESAPALVPFELRKAASTGAMADVFEEDEEEVTEETAVKTVSETPAKKDALEVTENKIEGCGDYFGEPGDEEESNVGIQVVESDMPEESPMTWEFEDSGLGIHRANKPRPLSFETQPLSLVARSTDCAESLDPIEVVEDYEEPRTSSLTRSSDSTVTPTFEDGPKELHQPITLAVPLPKQSVTTPDTIHSSSFSPDFRYRQNSFEGPRLGTAGSSIADNRTVNSFSFGEPGPEVRISTDDVPSLTSSRSTMTGGFQYGGFPILSPRNAGDRTSSISSSASAMSDRRRKRSSIASLSRLMTGSFGGERSKLYIEQRPQSEHMDLSTMKRPKDKKTKRLSKLMQFWRSSSYTK